MNTSNLPENFSHEVLSSEVVFYTMKQVQDKISGLTRTEWNQLRIENPRFFEEKRIRTNNSAKSVACIKDSDLAQLRKLHQALKIRKEKDRALRNSPQAEEEKNKRYLNRLLWSGSRVR